MIDLLGDARCDASVLHPPIADDSDPRGGRLYTCRMTEQQADLIAVDPDIFGGQAHIRGTRIPVSVVLDCLAAGLSEDKIIEQYPALSREGIRAAAAYGAALAREEIFPLPA